MSLEYTRLLSEGTAGCVHEMVFSGERYTSQPPQWGWICEKRGAQGVAMFSAGDGPKRDLTRYLNALERFDPTNAMLSLRKRSDDAG